MYTLFLTGGIGSGKSTVCGLLRERGARVIDLDAVAREVLDEPAVRRAVARRFGADVFVRPEGLLAGLAPCDECGPDDPFAGAGLDRALLAERAFATPGSTADLNAITHPRILERLGELLCEPSCCMGAAPRLCVVEVPLIESCPEAAARLADEVIAVTCPVELRRERAVARGMAGEDFDERDARQATDEQRAALAHTVLANDGDADALAAAVDAWWRLREEAGWPARTRQAISHPPATEGGAR